MKRILGKAFHYPADWLVAHTTARDRRSFGFWTFAGAVIGSIFFGTQVLWVSVLSVVALIPNITAETPVESEDAS